MAASDRVDIRSGLRRLRLLRALSWLALGPGIVVSAACVVAIGRMDFERWLMLVVLGGVILAFRVAEILERSSETPDLQTRPGGREAWQVGKYTAKEIRSLLVDVTSGLPWSLRNPRLVVDERRDTTGWTRLALFGLRWWRPNTVWVSSGSLHYLERDELEALVLHEVGHHARENRIDVPGASVVVDIALVCVSLRLCSAVGPLASTQGGIAAVILALTASRCAVALLAAKVKASVSRIIEHQCDLFAAERVGSLAVIHLLLKLGEECELEEIVVARAARQLLHVQLLDVEDLVGVLHDVRPHGRIFHRNLFRHAAAIVREVESVCGELLDEECANPDFAAFLRSHRRRPVRRIRWRSFDAKGDGRLSREEIDDLVAAVTRSPDALLFACESELEPTTHPRTRDRIVVVHQHAPA